MRSTSKLSLEYILNDFRKNFHNKRCHLSLNYKGLDSIEIQFHEHQLYHLLGIHKVTNKYRAKTAIEAIEKKHLTIDSIINHKEFNDIKYRIIGYKSLYSILVDPKTKLCILGKDLDKNTMQLDLVLWDNIDFSKMMILGLRKTSDGSYVPTTLHRTEKKKYDHYKRTRISAIIWI
ncbi:hypothetical protein JDW15_04750 [Aerococcaceae bacterium zg-ZJ1578]|uniref:PBECR4 domain-containing protein n=1 Tax=Aerococcaceae bacterium zg-252 TaxID=2796928 RepID=UPI001A26D182|nr:hypothetical protein [Aerococcaceae bacterium zg-1578]